MILIKSSRERARLNIVLRRIFILTLRIRLFTLILARAVRDLII